MNGKNKIIRNFTRVAIVLVLALGLALTFQPTGARACQEGPDLGYFANLFQGMTCDAGGHGAITAVGKFLFPFKWDVDNQVSEVNFGSKMWAYASVPDAEIKLKTKGNGIIFNWSAGAIFDKYALGEGVDPGSVNVNVHYDGALTGLSGFGIGLLGDQGFQLFGKLSPGMYGGDWTVSLADIASVNTDNEFCMAFGAFTFAWGNGSNAFFGESDFSDTFKLSFLGEGGNIVPVESQGGFSQVPIPSTILLLFPGLLGLIAVRRRRS